MSLESNEMISDPVSSGIDVNIADSSGVKVVLMETFVVAPETASSEDRMKLAFAR